MNNKSGFTMTLALVDLIPVVFFFVAAVAIGIRLDSKLVFAGASLCIIGGLGKVLWKILLATTKKDIHILFTQMRVLMPLGFLLIIVGIILKASIIDWALFISKAISFPAIAILILSIVALAGMIYMAGHLDQNDPKSNWIEQLTNCAAQGLFMVWILMIL